MSWIYRIDERAVKQLKKLDRATQRAILRYLDDRVAGAEDPRSFGKSLRGNFAEFWRYRVGDYRILCQIRDQEMIVLVINVGHRRDVYR
jgi:mRNA interferase RelE/StbE